MDSRFSWHSFWYFVLIINNIGYFVTGIQEDTHTLNDDNEVNGGWQLVDEIPIPDHGRCNIERRDGRILTQDEFINGFAFTEPVIIDHIDNTAFADYTKRHRMLEDWHDKPVILSSANTYSYTKVPSTFDEYLDKHLKPQNLDSLGNETLYLFGDIDAELWKPLLDKYELPQWTLPDHDPALSFGLAGAGTGVPFHTHGPGFAEVIHGSKRWFLHPFEKRPEFNPDSTTLSWYLNEYPKLKKDDLPFECLMKPGELIYFPNKWWHATLNMETSVFISTFLSPTSKPSKFKKRSEL